MIPVVLFEATSDSRTSKVEPPEVATRMPSPRPASLEVTELVSTRIVGARVDTYRPPPAPDTRVPVVLYVLFDDTVEPDTTTSPPDAAATFIPPPAGLVEYSTLPTAVIRSNRSSAELAW